MPNDIEPAMHAMSPSFDPSLARLRDPGRPVALIEDLKMLGRFRSKMARQKFPVNIARMMFDRAYAFDCIALGHSSADPSLQRLSVQLFSQYTLSDAPSH